MSVTGFNLRRRRLAAEAAEPVKTPGSHDDGKFAVMKTGNTRAIKILDSRDLADTYIDAVLVGERGMDKSELYVEARA